MSSNGSYSGYYAQDKGAYTSRPTTSSTSMLAKRPQYTGHDSNTHTAYSTASSRSLNTNPGNSSRSNRYSQPPVIHNGGGKLNDPNTSTSAPNGGYYN